MPQLLAFARFDLFPMTSSMSRSLSFNGATKIPHPSVYAPKSKLTHFRRTQREKQKAALKSTERIVSATTQIVAILMLQNNTVRSAICDINWSPHF